MRRDNSSRPSPSVPSQCSPEGGIRRSSMSMSVGLGSGNAPAKAARRRMNMVQTAAAQNSGPNRRARLTGVIATSSLMLSSSVAMTYPWVKHRVEHVDNEVHQHETTGDEQHHPLENNEVPGVDCPDEQPTEARQCENRLDNHRAANQAADVDAGDGDEGQRGRLQRVNKQDAGRLKSLCLGQCDVVLLQRRDHVGPQYA